MKLFPLAAAFGLVVAVSQVTNADVITFQTGQNGYTNGLDTTISGVNDGNGQSPVLWAEAFGGSAALIEFGAIFGNGPNQIPIGSQITSATLTLTRLGGSPTTNGYARIGHMLMDWDETSQAGDFGGFVDFNDIEASSQQDSQIDFSGAGFGDDVSVDVTYSVGLWANGTTNRGWALISTDSDLHTFASSEWATSAQTPRLTITYTAVPEPSSAGVLAPAAMWLGVRRRRSRRGCEPTPR